MEKMFPSSLCDSTVVNHYSITITILDPYEISSHLLTIWVGPRLCSDLIGQCL